MTYALERLLPGPPSSVNMPMLVLGRACTTAVFMTYPACLSWLMDAWQMTATRAGLVQGTFTAAFATSLLVVSFLCDRCGAKACSPGAQFRALLQLSFFGAVARSFESALVCMALLGLGQGATYSPAIMLASANAPPNRVASAVGWVLAGINAGGNLGADVWVSGTVAAVRESTLYGKPGIALSHASLSMAFSVSIHSMGYPLRTLGMPDRKLPIP
jgi:MFS family permease